MQTVSLCDKLFFSPNSELIIKTNLDLPTKDNLIFKAYELISDFLSTKKGVNIELHKEIPMQAGLGGGSCDAAATLIGLNRLWKCGLSLKQLSAIGAKLGSDIPFFIEGSYAIIEGRGDIVTQLLDTPRYDIILIKPDFNISTAWAYQRITEYSDVSFKYCHKLDNALLTRDFAQIQLLMKNDFEPALKGEFPEIGHIKTSLMEQGAISAMLSGSGSAVFGIYPDQKSALTCLAKLSEIYPDYWLRHVKTL